MNQTKSVKLTVRVWVKHQANGVTKIHIAGDGIRSRSVNNQPGLMRYHPALFRDLKEVLVRNGKWLRS